MDSMTKMKEGDDRDSDRYTVLVQSARRVF